MLLFWGFCVTGAYLIFFSCIFLFLPGYLWHSMTSANPSHTEFISDAQNANCFFFGGVGLFFVSKLFVVRLFFYCPLFFFLFLFCIVLFFSLRASRNCIKFWLLKVKHGFQLSLSFFSGPYFLSMLSIDECFDEIHQCDSLAKCHNTPGNYSCQCPDGYSSQWKDCIGEAGV